jgi:enolase
MNTIKEVKAREILDSRGNPTIEVDITLKDGSFGRASVPSGASTGSHEATELRDSDKDRFSGKGVLKAVENVNIKIAKEIIGKNFDQTELDKKLIELDSTENKSNLGANALLGVSMAFSHAMAKSQKIPLYEYFHKISDTKEKASIPVPMILILEGGKHADNGSDLQEFMIVPHGAPSFKESLRWGSEIYHATAKILKSKGFNTNVGFEGAFGPNLESNEKVIDLIIEGIKSAGYTPGTDVGIAIDAAASEFYENEIYNLKTENKKLSSKEMVEYYVNWCNKYPIVSIEDGLAEDDWTGYEMMTKKLGNKIQIVGDDLFVTNTKRLKIGIEKGVANSILIKLNQIGTVTETIETIKMAKKAGYKSIISHRSGETEDTTIADFAVGLATGQIKTGAPSRGERTAKYNQLLRIEEIL